MDSASNSLVSAWLPHPTYHVPDRTKKSHARRRSINHIPRPRNAFILFRCDFVQQQKVPLEVENDHRNLSRISGNVWRLMTPDERAPWVRMAEEEKIKHRILYPEYTYRNRTRNGLGRYDPVGKAKKELLGVSVSKKARKVPDRRNEVKIPRVPDGLHETGAFDSFIRATENELSFPVPRRHSSCPPGAPRVLDPTPDPTLLIDPSRPQTLLVARDDLARRPSNIVMYASTAALSYCQSTSSEPPISSWAHLAPTSRILAELGTEVLDVGLPLTTGPYVVDHSQFGIHNHDHSSNFNVGSFILTLYSQS
ncbi:hypothetical protein H0H87_006348 [Tephrocybe sp. NHM501043]|nr:hypothetical protein H0H87_006348 [Tephrocybe sp. NHM501043]